MAQKYYVVWSGRSTGVFDNWPTTLASVDQYAGAKYKAFASRAEAEQALRDGAQAHIGKHNQASTKSKSERAAAHIAHRAEVSIYCDGACEPNPGDAGSGIVVYRNGALAELWYGFYNPQGTNNSAELNALHEALRIAETELQAGRSVEICSDSQYAINCVKTWAPGWEAKGWVRKDGEIKNLDIIKDSYAIFRRLRDADFTLTHVAAHVGTEGNELADRMAMHAALTKTTGLQRFEGAMDVAALLKMQRG